MNEADNYPGAENQRFSEMPGLCNRKTGLTAREMIKETIREAGFLEYGNQPKSVVEVLEQYFGINFKREITAFLIEHSGEMGEKGRIPSGWKLIRVAGIEYYWIKSILQQPMSEIWMDLIFRCRIQNCVTNDERKVYIAVREKLSLRPCHPECSRPAVRFYIWNEKDPLFDQKGAIKLNKYLLPFIKKVSFSQIAMRLLETFYPKDLSTSDEIVSGEVLAEEMGLKRVAFPFPKGDGDTDMGRMMFLPDLITVKKDDGSEADYDIAAGTILINTRCCRTERERNATILHECVHFVLDRFFFYLQLIVSRNPGYGFGRSQAVVDAEEYAISTGRGQNTNRFSATDWMEYQAERLPIYLVLNEAQTRRFLEQWISEMGGGRTPAVMQACIERLSEKFDVSRSMAKIRMIELGYTEAQGVYNFDSSHKHLRDYSCSKWKEGVSYCIEPDELADLLVNDDKAAKAVGSGLYRYVDHHLCLNHPAYVRKTGSRYEMTEYGNDHLDECCMSFYRIHSGMRQPGGSYFRGRRDGNRLLSYASRIKKEPVTDIYRPVPAFHEEAEGADLLREVDFSCQEASRWAKLESRFPADFGGSVKMIMDAKNLTQEEVALRLDVSRTMVQNMLSNDRLSLSHVVGLCLALEIPYFISETLVDKANLSLNPNGIATLYRVFLVSPEVYTPEVCGRILAIKKLPPLFEK